MGSDNYGLKQVHLDEMVQLCMVGPMAAKPLDWKSKELAALVAYTQTQQRPSSRPSRRQSCAAKNPALRRTLRGEESLRGEEVNPP